MPFHTIDDPDVRAWLEEALFVGVRCGYGSEARVTEAFIERVQDELNLWSAGPEALAPWRQVVAEALAAQRAREATWTGRTHNDRIDAAFDALEAQGVIALQDAGYTMSDGWSDVAEARGYEADAWGAVFFHRQDVERGVRGEGLMLAFGAFASGETHESESLRVARLACELLEAEGVATEWSGSVDSRVSIKPFAWRRRRR